MNLKVKALNVDSESEIARLCSLYSRSYGEKFNLTPLDASRFWKSRVGNRFTTIVVQSDSRFIASVSLRPDRDNPAHIQLYMPVCDPDCLAEAVEIRTAIADLMHRLSLRQNWEMIYSYQFLQIPEQAWFSHFLVDGTDVALWPACLPSGSKQDRNKKSEGRSIDKSIGSVLISQRVLAVPSASIELKTVLFAPTKHLDFCRWVYNEMGLSFTITNQVGMLSKDTQMSKEFFGDLSAAPTVTQALALPADRRAIERQAHRQAGFSICFVEPGLTSGFRELENILQRKALCADYVALNMLDPMTPAFAEQLEQIGFGLGGVLPYHRNRHTLLFYRTDASFNWDSIKNDSALIDYLKTNDNSNFTNFLSPIGKNSSSLNKLL